MIHAYSCLNNNVKNALMEYRTCQFPTADATYRPHNLLRSHASTQLQQPARPRAPNDFGLQWPLAISHSHAGAPKIVIIIIHYDY